MLALEPVTPPRRLVRWGFRLAALAAIGIAVALDQSTIFVVALLFVLVVPFEKMFPRHRGQRIRRPLAALDVRYALVNPLLNVVGITFAVAVALVSLAWLPGLALRPLVSMLPGWATITLAVVLFDMLTYWGHRWMHEVPQLWRFHAIHHSTEHLDWISGFRLHPLDGIVIAPPAVFLLVAGIEPEVVGALAVLQVAVGLFLHANVRWRLRPLHRLVATPEFHHWHHANEPDAHCTNYSGLFPIWDQVFGTYSMPRTKRPVRYGVDDPVPPTMRGQLMFPFRGMPKVRTMLRHPWRTFRTGVRGVRTIAEGVWRSTRRPRLAARTARR